jgi:protein subunit release factor B
MRVPGLIGGLKSYRHVMKEHQCVKQIICHAVLRHVFKNVIGNALKCARRTIMELKQEDIRMDTFRTAGMKTNETDNAVRLIHIPTGVTVSYSAGHSLHENRAIAMRMLKEQVGKMNVLCDEMDSTGKNVLI